MNTIYTKEEMEALGKKALKGLDSAYAHVHSNGSIYFDHQDELHIDNDNDHIKVINESLKKAEATSEDLTKLSNELKVEQATHGTTKDLLETEKAEHQKSKDALTSALKEIENLQAKVAELEKPVKAPEPDTSKTEEKGTKK